MRSIPAIFVGTCLIAISSCAYDGSDGYGDRAEVTCLSDYEIRSFGTFDDRHLYVEGRGDTHYLLTMERGCIGLRSAESIAITDNVGRICSNTYDEIIYRDLGRGQTSCRIRNIEPVHDREDAKELVTVRREARRNNESDD